MSADSVAPLRIKILGGAWLLGIVFTLLSLRLYALQIVRGEEMQSRGQENFVQDLDIPHDRGIIFDRYGRIVVDNRASLDLYATPAFLGPQAEARRVLQRLGELVGFSASELSSVRSQIEQKRSLERFRPVLVKKDLSPDELETIEAERSIFHLDGVTIVEGRRRTYRYGTLASHLLGYVNEIDSAALEAARRSGNPRDYGLGDLIGREGAERTFEKMLRGVDGREQVVVDAKGKRQPQATRELLLSQHNLIPPKPGHNVFLSIDLDLQQRAEAAFSGRAGAVVAMDVRTGAILAMTSSPAFDPNRVSGAFAKEEKERLDGDVLKPWLNRPLQGQYAPGSTFKAFTALAALKERATSGKDQVFCPGSFRMGRHTWRCHKDRGHGPVNLLFALKVSCDTFFYTMGARVGIDAIAEAARDFGLGAPTAIALRGEKRGLTPDEAWHDKADAASGGYQRGMSVNTAIGQGALLVTPLQLAVAYAAIANSGRVLTPQILDRVETPDTRVVFKTLAKDGTGKVTTRVSGEPPTVVEHGAPHVAHEALVPQEFWDQLHGGLDAVVNEAGGTAFFRRLKGIRVAGKTGTSQVMRLGRERLDVDEVDYFERDHAWFVGYAPVESPEIVVVALNEHAGHGSSHAAPIAMAVIEAYFELEAGRAPLAALDNPE